ncbi:MAG: RluA family pseudouridine synthase [Epsilonproteobacteria bacterium]|nr:RluA family pseudouridine synthase [Campylobacterota bacterium]
MAKDKAYKLLAIQEGISNSKAKELIDKGIVTCEGKKLLVARGEISDKSVFKIKEIPSVKVIFQDNDILAVDKPAYISASEVEDMFPHAKLLNRLDKETSGVMLMAKNEEFRGKAIKEFMDNKVYKEYVAIVDGKVIDEFKVDLPILTIKGKTAKSKIDLVKGKPALTIVTPYMVEGHKSKVQIVIENGRTHQIRVHLQHAGHPIIGDLQYGKHSNQVQRVMLHSKITKILDYEFEAREPREFFHFGF